MQIAKRIVHAVFTYGNVLDASAVFLKILKHPEIRELSVIGAERGRRHSQVLQSIIDNLNKYLTTIMATKGSRTTLEQRAYRTVMAACSGTNLQRNRHVSHASSLLVIYLFFVMITFVPF